MKKIMNKKIKILIAGIILIITVAVVSVFIFKDKQPASDKLDTIAWINGIPVARGEAALFISGKETEEGLKRAVESLIWYKILQDKLMQAGQIDDISYESFLEELEKENNDRLKKQKEGQVLYGPVKYSEKVYYGYLHESYQSMWKESVNVEPSDEELKEMYDKDETLYRNFGDVTLQYLSFEGENYTTESMTELHKQIETAVLEGQNFDTVIKELGLNNVLDERTFTQSDLSTPDVTAYPEISEVIHVLDEGCVSTPIDLGNQGLIFYCKERKHGSRTPFDECKDALKEIYKENYMEKVIEQEKKQAVIIYADENE